MADRHRGGGRTTDFGRGRDGGREEGRPTRENRSSRGGRETYADRRQRGDQGTGGGFGRGAPYRERGQFRPPATEAMPVQAPGQEQFEEVDAGLAIAILETAAHLTEIVGTAGLPEGYVERREAVVETFEAIYYHVLETVTGGEEASDE